MSALRVGLVGAGSWARMFHAPMLAAGPETKLVAVWSRRADAARKLADRFGAAAPSSYEELIGICDALAFAVPPDVQAELVPRAATAGRAMLLEKPIAPDLQTAQDLVATIQAAGVPTQVLFTNRYSPRSREFIADAKARTPVGAIATFISGSALPGKAFHAPWRVSGGSLLDLGPHVLDMLDITLGPIVKVTGAGDPTRWYTLTMHHENGVVSQGALSSTTPVVNDAASVRIWTEQGEIECHLLTSVEGTDVAEVVRREFAEVVRSGISHRDLDASRALHIQRLMHEALAS